MSKGTLYLIDPEWDGDPEDVDQAVVEAWNDTFDKFFVAKDLWGLLDERAKAARIGEILSAAVGRQRENLEASEIQELLNLLDGLEARICSSGYVDSQRDLVPGRLDELRSHQNYRLDFSDANPRLQYVFDDAMIGVQRLRHVLSRALGLGLEVALP